MLKTKDEIRLREPVKVLEDVRNEVVSLAAARDIYKVEINTDGMEIDIEKSKMLRDDAGARRQG